jgi:hypothetical protein
LSSFKLSCFVFFVVIVLVIVENSFHQSVKESLEDPKHKPEVLEFTSTMTPTMEEIHKSIITVMNACIKELQRISSVLFFLHIK